jgi:hypothetical protein
MRSGRVSIVAAALALALLPACRASSYAQMTCSDEQRQNLLHLVAQAVPSATVLPCVRRFPTGWSYAGAEVRSGLVHFWLDSDRVGTDAVDVTMTATCDVTGDMATPMRELPMTPSERRRAGDAGLVLYEEPAAEHPSITVLHYVAPGGCATVRYSFTRQTAATEFAEAQGLLGYNLRSDYVAGIQRESGLTLCGAGAPARPG